MQTLRGTISGEAFVNNAIKILDLLNGTVDGCSGYADQVEFSLADNVDRDDAVERIRAACATLGIDAPLFAGETAHEPADRYVFVGRTNDASSWQERFSTEACNDPGWPAFDLIKSPDDEYVAVYANGTDPDKLLAELRSITEAAGLPHLANVSVEAA